MMFFDVLRAQYMAMAFLGGLVALVCVVLTYMMMWTPRLPQEKIGRLPITGWRSFRAWAKFIPWVLTLTYIAITAFVVWYSIAKMINPPNW
jgi:type II secretory pathway component PulM